jgi:hypothetical protein|nr:MAG TPA: putative tail fiber protein [Caudoviricetes sp.]
MSYTNKTKKLHLPQWVGTDRPTYLVDFNTAFLNIDNAFVAQDVEIAGILSKLNQFISKMLGTGDDLNNLDNGHYSLPPNEDYVKQNRPTKKAGFLYVYNDNVGTWQIYVDSDSQMYIRSKMHDGNWSSWNRLVGESEYKNFVNNVNNDITQIRDTANNAESVANSAKNVADSAKNVADSGLEKATNNEANLTKLNKLNDYVIGTGPLMSTRIPANGGTAISFPTLSATLLAGNYEVIGVVQMWLPQNKGRNVIERYEFTGTKCELTVHNLTSNEIIVEPDTYQVKLRVIEK